MTNLSTLNATAYRVYKILAWLMDKPMSVDDLNSHLLEDKLIRRNLSGDTILLYINTLKTLGCEISRPTPTNGFCYQLSYHPFNILLSEEEVQTIINTKELAEHKLSYQDILWLDRFFKKIIKHVSLSPQQKLVEDIFTQSRSVDYEALLPKIETLDEQCKKGQLLMVKYLSPVKNKECFYFLPEKLAYQRGILYLQGSRPNYNELVLLRIEKIIDFEPVTQDEIYQQLKHYLDEQSRVVILIHQMDLETFNSLGMGETVEEIEIKSEKCLRLTIQTRELFLLKQRILETGYRFTVLEPEHFRDDMLKTLYAMESLYARKKN